MLPINNRQKIILMGVLQDQWRLAQTAWSSPARSRESLGRIRLHIQQAQAGLVPMNLAGWLGHAPTNSECVQYHREYARLEGMGLIERHNLTGQQRTSHLKLTPAGRELAEQLLEDERAEDTEATAIDWSKVEFLPIEMPEDQDQQ